MEPGARPAALVWQHVDVFGNCGNSIAPLAGAQRDEIVDLLCFLEDLPLQAFRQEIPWTWEDWPQYARAPGRTADGALNVGATWAPGPAHLRDGSGGLGAGGERR